MMEVKVSVLKYGDRNLVWSNNSLKIFQKTLKIRFPLSLYLKDRSFSWQIIDQIEVENRPGTRTVPRFFVITKNGKRLKFHYSGHDDDTKAMVEYFRSHGIKVEIIKKYFLFD